MFLFIYLDVERYSGLRYSGAVPNTNTESPVMDRKLVKILIDSDAV